MSFLVTVFEASLTLEPARFAAAVGRVLETAKLPLILMASDPEVMAKGLQAAEGVLPLIYGAGPDDWEGFAELAKEHEAPMAIRADSLSDLAELTEKIKGAGVEEIVLDPNARDIRSSLAMNTLTRRMALKKTFRPLGFPLISFPGECARGANGGYDAGMVSVAATPLAARSPSRSPHR